jgi:OPT family oligopeptide transporter
MWTIAMIFTTFGSGVNMLLSLRRPSIVITAIVAQLLSYPLGRLWARYMPERRFTTFGYTWSLNPGPFNIKEHTLIVLASNVSYGGGAAYATDILLGQKVFYGQNFGGAFACLLVISTQCIGYSFAGVMRRFLVWPAAMMWPTTLINATLFHTLFRDEDPREVPGWRISRFKYFFIVFGCMFCWVWIPSYIFTALSPFAFVTWIKPNDVVVNQVFGAWTGKFPYLNPLIGRSRCHSTHC